MPDASDGAEAADGQEDTDVDALCTDASQIFDGSDGVDESRLLSILRRLLDTDPLKLSQRAGNLASALSNLELGGLSDNAVQLFTVAAVKLIELNHDATTPIFDMLMKQMGSIASCEINGKHYKGFRRPDGSMASAVDSVKAEARRILAETPDGVEVTNDQKDFLLALLKYHPNAEQKMSKPVKTIVVGPHQKVNVRCFLLVRGEDGSEDTEDFSYVRCCDHFYNQETLDKDRAQDIARKLATRNGEMMDLCASYFEEKFPHRLRHESQLQSFVDSMFRICRTIPHLRDHAMRITIARMSVIDSAIVLEHEDGIDDTLASNEEDGVCVNAQKLDALMGVTFAFVKDVLDAHPVHHQAVDDLFAAAVDGFQESVLPNEKCKYVQFVVFYMASFSITWAETFLTILLRKMYDNQSSLAVKRMAAAYLSSFIVRLSNLPARFSRITMHYLVQFAHDVLGEVLVLRKAGQDTGLGRVAIGGGSVDVSPKYTLLLSLVQAICYVLVWKIDEWMEVLGQHAPEDTDPQKIPLGLSVLVRGVNGGGINGLLRNELCPLSQVNHIVVAEWDKMCRRPKYKDLLYELRVEAVGVSAGRKQFLLRDALSSVFPFDPYKLRKSCMYVSNVYKEWSALHDDDTEAQTESPAADSAAISPSFMQHSLNGSVTGKRKRWANPEGSDEDQDYSGPPPQKGYKPTVAPSPMLSAIHPTKMPRSVVSPVVTARQNNSNIINSLPSPVISASRPDTSIIGSLPSPYLGPAATDMEFNDFLDLGAGADFMGDCGPSILDNTLGTIRATRTATRGPKSL